MNRIRERRAAFTLLEVLLVLIIIGLLASLVAPAIFGMKDKADRDTARGQVNLLYSACENYRLAMNDYPTSLDQLVSMGDAANSSKWAGPYLTGGKLPKDPWGRDYVYQNTGQGTRPQISSAGKDGQPGTGDDIYEEEAQ